MRGTRMLQSSCAQAGIIVLVQASALFPEVPTKFLLSGTSHLRIALRKTHVGVFLRCRLLWGILLDIHVWVFTITGVPTRVGQDVLPALSGWVQNRALLWRQDIQRRQRPWDFRVRSNHRPHRCVGSMCNQDTELEWKCFSCLCFLFFTYRQCTCTLVVVNDCTLSRPFCANRSNSSCMHVCLKGIRFGTCSRTYFFSPWKLFVYKRNQHPDKRHGVYAGMIRWNVCLAIKTIQWTWIVLNIEFLQNRWSGEFIVRKVLMVCLEWLDVCAFYSH